MFLNNKLVNKATWFLLPMFGNSQVDFTENKKYPYIVDLYNFVNIYLSDINKPYYDQHIFIVYKVPNKCTTEYIQQCIKLTKNSNFVKEYNYIYNKETYVIFCYKIPDNYYRDYKLILDGKYSEINEVYKKKILKFWDLGIKSRIATILYKLKDHYLLYKFKDTIGECEIPINIKDETLPEEIEIEINEIE